MCVTLACWGYLNSVVFTYLMLYVFSWLCFRLFVLYGACVFVVLVVLCLLIVLLASLDCCFWFNLVLMVFAGYACIRILVVLCLVCVWLVIGRYGLSRVGVLGFS